MTNPPTILWQIDPLGPLNLSADAERMGTEAFVSLERYEALIGRCSEQYSNSINETSVEDALITEEEISKVLGIIERHLDSCESRAITLRHGSSMNIKEVAEKMHMKTRSVSRYISVGLKKVRQLLTVERGD